MKKLGIIFAGVVLALSGISAHAAELSGTASVSITSDTSASAKNIAMDEARRQIIVDSLSHYSMPDQLRAAVADAKNSELTNLIASSEISGERQSDTTYSANITMTIDRGLARTWLNAAGVQNWLPDDTSGDKFVVVAYVSDPIADWIGLQEIARNEKLDLSTKYMNNGQVTIELPVARRGEFTAAVRGAGWRYSDNDGVLRIWK